jgi:hypothetical protein
MPTEKRGVWAHVECGAYIPETSVELIQEGLALIDDQITAELKSGQDTGEDASAQANIAGTADPVSVGDLSQASSAEIADQTQFNSPNNIGQASSQEENKKSTTLDPAELNPNPDSYTDKEESIAPYRVLGISEVPADRKRLKCGYCQWDGPISRDLGACIQCTRVTITNIGEMHSLIPCHMCYLGWCSCRTKR